MPGTIPFAQHLFKRLQQLNCHSIHGVPGDFFLRALDHIRPSGSKWIGNANELCAGYAADGYARTAIQIARHTAAQGHRPAPTIGAYMTTYGVGELSAINALAGSCAERVPVVQIVGTPSWRVMRHHDAQRPIHHSLPGTSNDSYAAMVDSIVCKTALLHHSKHADSAAEMLDDAIKAAVTSSKPAYVALPNDMVDLPISQDLSEAPLAISHPADWSPDRRIVQDILRKLSVAKAPLFIADGLSYSMGIQSDLNELISLTNIPTMCFTSGKGIVDEDLPAWSPALPNTTEYSKHCDLLLIFGPLLSDTNTARWSAIPDAKNTVHFNLNSVEIDGHVHQESSGESLLRAVVSGVKASPTLFERQPVRSDTAPPVHRSSPSHEQSITQDDLWPLLSSYIKPEDTLLLANGTPLIGGRMIHLQRGCQVIASPIWNAIGSMLPTAQGVAAAKRDHQLPGRTILFEGDGSFQVTCQALSDIIRYSLNVTIFIINNAGYTYERHLNGMTSEYNDVPSWRYIDAPSFFGAQLDDSTYPVFARRAETWGQLLEILAEEKANDGNGLKIVDIVVHPEDVPSAAIPGLQRASKALRSG